MCKSCASGYYLNPNNYIQSVFKQAVVTPIYPFLLSVFQEEISKSLPSPCQEIIHKNCDVPANAFECNQCLNNFYLAADKTCKPFPQVKISNCLVYTKSDICAKCEEGYFLFNASKECKVHSNKDVNCSILSQVLENACDLCKGDYFLSGNTCQKRVDSVSIAQCSTRNPRADTCLTCNSSFLVTSDGRKCLSMINNCITYQSGSNINNTAFICIRCGN